MPRARSLRGKVGRQSLSGGQACLYSRSNSRQLCRDPPIWAREYAKIDANAREDNIYKITKISGEANNEPSNRGRRVRRHCATENRSPIGLESTSESFGKYTMTRGHGSEIFVELLKAPAEV
jgi:hypothetical protein